MEKINELIEISLKSGDKIRVGVYRLIKSEFLKFKTAKNAGVLDDAAKIGIIQKMVKQREESVRLYNEGGRSDLADAENAEIEVLKEFLPAMPTTEDITKWLNANYPDGVDKKQMGIVIGQAKKALVGVDGKTLADCVKSILK